MRKNKPIRKLLAANRSEIAIRIFRAANELGLRTVGIYSQEDRLALHRFKADEAYQVGAGKGPVEAYLDIAGIVALAKEKGVDAIHPGYGFLSENPAFARTCEKAGIAFIGPTPELLALLGDKTAARRLARSAGVPVLPGTGEPVKSYKRSAQIRYRDWLSRHRQGCDGRRRARYASCARRCLAQLLQEAGGEANPHSASQRFSRKYLPRAILQVQILGDNRGNLLHRYERDCSGNGVIEVRRSARLEFAACARDFVRPRSLLYASQLSQRRHGRFHDVDARNWYSSKSIPSGGTHCYRW
jgi:pyruvate carboxylase